MKLQGVIGLCTNCELAFSWLLAGFRQPGILRMVDVAHAVDRIRDPSQQGNRFSLILVAIRNKRSCSTCDECRRLRMYRPAKTDEATSPAPTSGRELTRMATYEGAVTTLVLLLSWGI